MIKAARFYVLFFLLGLSALYVYTRSEAAVPTNKPLDQFPQRVGHWVMTGQARFDEQVLKILKPSDYLSRTYQDQNGNTLSLYIGFHNGGPDSGPIHSPKQCLPGSGWNRQEEKVRSVSIADQKIPYVSAIYQKDVERQLFLYWFQVREDILTNEYALKLAMAKNSFLSNRKDSAFIRIGLSINESDEQSVINTGEQFIRDFFPLIKSYLPI